MTSEREQKLEAALAQFLKPIKGIPFEVIIKSLCGHTVEKFNPDLTENAALLVTLNNAMRDACLAVHENPIERARPNEVGNDMEPFVVAGLVKNGLTAASPKTKSGLGKATGYPDLLIERQGLPSVYLEVKSYAAATHETTQRSFYLSPSDNPKVTQDACHLLVGFEIERAGNLYQPVAFEVVDLYGLDCDMKAEFNSDNRRVYQSDRVLSKVRL